MYLLFDDLMHTIHMKKASIYQVATVNGLEQNMVTTQCCIKIDVNLRAEQYDDFHSIISSFPRGASVFTQIRRSIVWFQAPYEHHPCKRAFKSRKIPEHF